MYSRQIADKTYTFEASGGLLHAGLVMQDRETDSYWSIITETAIHGEAQGQGLRKLSGAVKTTWGDWRRQYPHSKVLSVDGVEHVETNPYSNYFASDGTFRDLGSHDERLPAKEQIFVFHRDGRAHAVPHRSFLGGALVSLGDRTLFVHRAKDDALYRSTAAFLLRDGVKVERQGGSFLASMGETSASWNVVDRRFDGGEGLFESFEGFDTFWYIWSNTNPNSEILEGNAP